MTTETEQSLVPIEAIAQSILVLRRKRVMLDSSLASLYGVTTKRLNEQVKRNQDRFPDDFVFQLTSEEKSEVVANCDHLRNLKFSKTLPYAFTEHGALMAASVLNTPRAVQVSVFVVRAFIQLREVLSSHVELSYKLDELESRVDGHDEQIADLIEVIRRLLAPPEPPPVRRIGYRISDIKLPYIVTPMNQEIHR